MIRMSIAILAGLIAFVILEIAFGYLAQMMWREYAAAAADRAYTLPMLIARLSAGAVATVAAGMITAQIARRYQNAALWFGAAMLTLSIFRHYQIWDVYPVWYHLAWFGCLIPAALLGGRLSKHLR